MTSHRGPLVDALRDAVADLADCAPGDVRIDVKAPDLDIEMEAEVSISAVDVEHTPRPAASPPARSAASPAASPAARPAPRHRAATGSETDVADGDDEPVVRDDEPVITQADLDEEADAAADFLEGLLDALELPGDLKIRVHEDHAEVEIVDVRSGALIGRRGQTLESIQELVRCALQREFQRRARVKVEVEGYRARRMEKLEEKAREAIEAVLDGADPERLEPMDVFERKAIHKIVAEYDGVMSRSQGREPARRIVIERE